MQESIHIATQGVADLRFEEDEDEDAYYTKDLPEHACRFAHLFTLANQPRPVVMNQEKLQMFLK